MSALVTRTATELKRMLRAGDVSVSEIVRAHLERIVETEEQVRAHLQVRAEQALAQADELDRRRTAGEALGPLAGLPLALKDVLCTRGEPTTCGSKILEGYRPPYDATAVARLAEADAVVVGKTNLDEFAMGSSTENSAFGPSRNPWDLDRVPGGSSGGSAAAVAALHAPLGVGTDTGGSVRQPAALCGLVGVKPTYGRVSRYGLIAFGSSLDQVGTLTRSVQDAALLLGALAGPDPRDTTALDDPVPDYTDGLDAGVDGLRVGVVAGQLAMDGLEPAVRRQVDIAAQRFAALGAEVVEVDLPHASYGISAYYLIAPSEASSNLSRFDGVRYGLRQPGESSEQMMARTRDAGFGPEVKRRIMIGTYALSAGYYDAYYAQASRVRRLIAEDFATAFATCDVVIGPTTPGTAFALGEKTDDPLAMYLTDIFSVPASLAGTPALSLPVGFDDAGLPVGLQIMAPVLGEQVMLRAAAALEADLDLDLVPHGPGALAAPTTAGATR